MKSVFCTGVEVFIGSVRYHSSLRQTSYPPFLARRVLSYLSKDSRVGTYSFINMSVEPARVQIYQKELNFDSGILEMF